MFNAGVCSIVLPAAGRRAGTEMYYVGPNGYYWSSTLSGESGACGMNFYDGNVFIFGYDNRYGGLSVRLVQDY